MKDVETGITTKTHEQFHALSRHKQHTHHQGYTILPTELENAKVRPIEQAQPIGKAEVYSEKKEYLLRGQKQKYPVVLSEPEVEQLADVLKRGEHTRRERQQAQMLLWRVEGKTDLEIAALS